MPESPRYHPQYCEENIWHLARERADQHDGTHRDDFVAVISNQDRTVAMWSHRAASQTGEPVVWDYHVVLIDASRATPMTWDLDSILKHPTPLSRWWRGTFPLEEACPDHLRPMFRVLPAETYLNRFSSDRSHMLKSSEADRQSEWLAEPPPWDRIYEPSEGMNLPRFVDMESPFVGEVLTTDEFKERFDFDRSPAT